MRFSSKKSSSKLLPTLLGVLLLCIISYQAGRQTQSWSSVDLESLTSSYFSDTTNSLFASSSALSSTDASTNYQKAKEESLGFFDDVSDREWDLLKERVRQVHPNKCPYCNGGTNAHAWFQNHFEPELACRHERRIGRLGDGGKWVCDPHRLKSGYNNRKECLVYSVGSNNDFSFERAVKSDIGDHCEIHTFDPANYSEGAAGTSIYHQWGIDGVARTDFRKQQYKTLAETVKELGHVGRTIDIFKIDCEGCEFSSYQTWVDESQVGVSLQQVLVEIHGFGDAKKIGHLGQKVKEPETTNFFQGMKQHGYVIFHKEPNTHYWRFRPCVEFGLLKLNQTFFAGMNTV